MFCIPIPDGFLHLSGSSVWLFPLPVPDMVFSDRLMSNDGFIDVVLPLSLKTLTCYILLHMVCCIDHITEAQLYIILHCRTSHCQTAVVAVLQCWWELTQSMFSEMKSEVAVMRRLLVNKAMFSFTMTVLLSRRFRP